MADITKSMPLNVMSLAGRLTNIGDKSSCKWSGYGYMGKKFPREAETQNKLYLITGLISIKRF